VADLIHVCPCIIYENDERYQLDATIVIYDHKCHYYMFRAYRCPKHVEIYKSQLLHQVGTSRHFHVCSQLLPASVCSVHAV
jgi:hypothetical protein